MSTNSNRLVAAKQEYQRRKLSGLCVKCGKVPASEGIARCAPCAKVTSENGKRYFRRHKAARIAHMNWYRDQHFLKGLCIHCPEPATAGCVCCARCLGKARSRYQRKNPRARIIGHAPKRARRVDRVAETEAKPTPVCLECGQNPPMRDQAICWCCANPPAPKAEKPKHARTHVATS